MTDHGSRALLPVTQRAADNADITRGKNGPCEPISRLDA